MAKPTDKFHWTDQAPGDAYILGERSYDCLFSSPDSLLPTDRWLDLGAHVGYFAVRIAPYVGFVLAVEPEPLNAQHLWENVQLNWANNVDLIQAAAIGGSQETVELGLGKTFSYTHKVGHTRGRKHIIVPAVNINSLIFEHRINKIKMDVEGMEWELLFDVNFDPIEEIIYEHHFTLIPDPDWFRLRQVLGLLKTEGFEILRAPVDPAKPTKRWTCIVWAKRF